jgi:hypothetical protein
MNSGGSAAYVQGVRTRKVEVLVQSLGITGISKSERMWVRMSPSLRRVLLAIMLALSSPWISRR